ncbi:MAG: molybdopterin dehydrogenase [Sulfobacillus benefaciens]|uniref:Molybdopterin dehydrogenase n=1 Tax=Sulfobacillus benefaciens TaxID=453960 RepID=A0A2T2XE16_9FIRM|nr:MAG: molybdopterin dehydrogenase [Sulfobacillus benefaciens]
MKPAPFDFIRAESVDDVIAILSHTEDAKILAGGQSLVAMMNMRLARPSTLVTLRGVPGLDAIEEKDGVVTVGAMVVQERLRSMMGHRQEFGALAEGIGYIGHPQTRSMGTVGGSIAHADPSAELPLLLQVYRGSVKTAGPSGVRQIAAEDFFQFPFSTALEPEEIMVATHWPVPIMSSGGSFREFSRRRGDFAIVAVACHISIEHQRLVDGRLGAAGVAGTAVAVDLPADLRGQPLITDEAATHWLETLMPHLDPPDDLEASSVLRRTLVETLGREAMAEAWVRAGGGTT